MKIIILYVWLCCIFYLSFCANSLSASDPIGKSSNVTQPLIIAYQEWPEWEPGLPREIRQVVLHSDGSGQVAHFIEHSIKELKVFHHTFLFDDIFKGDSFLRYSNSYLLPEEPGLLVEGYPLTLKLLFYTNNPLKTKIIDCHLEVMPKSLKVITDQIKNIAAQANRIAIFGIYIVAQPLSEQESSEVKSLCAPYSFPTKTLSKLTALRESLEKPLFLIKIPQDQIADIQEELHLKNLFDEAGSFATQNDIVSKIRLYSTANFKDKDKIF